jgi:aryl-alcohol dehydrogenase-like predicted oxidoreductase
MEKRGVRDEIVLATKYTYSYNMHMKDELIQANYIGNHAKSLKLSVEKSLQNLKTDYVDLVRIVDLLIMFIETKLTEI